MSLRLIEVSLRYGSQLALDRLNLHVRRGDLYGFLGHNGAGKTTAMRVVLGLVEPDDGQVVIDGFDAATYPREARARLGGLIEVPGFHGHLDGAGNLRRLAELQGLEPRAARLEAQRVLQLVGLSEAGAKPVVAYSHGMRQRLGIAQALLGSPAYVLLDEPTNGLDPEGIAEVRDVLRRAVREAGATVMLSTHQLHEVEGLCNRVAVISKGRRVVEAETSALFAKAGRRFRLRAKEVELAAQQLTARGVSVERSAEGLEFDLGDRAPADVARALFEAGVAIESFAPRPASLEEVYLLYSRSSPEPTPEVDRASSVVAAPAERRAPRGAIRSVVRYEWARVFPSPWMAILLCAPAALAGLAVWRAHLSQRERLAQVADQELFSATDVTAFEALGSALAAGLPVAMLVLAGIASQSIAGELARGTLRNVLLRPLTRTQVVLGKFAAQGLIALATLALLVVASLAASAWAFDFGDVTEILPNGERYEHVSAAELRPELARVLCAPILPILACAALGFAAGALVRGAAGALGLTIGLLLGGDLARVVLRGLDAEGWLLSAYLPSPLGDTSYVRYYSDLAQGVSNAVLPFPTTQWIVPLLWLALSFLLARTVLVRRAVP